MVLAKCKDTSGSCAVVKGALFLHLPNLSGSVVFLMKSYLSICHSSVCYAMEIIICSANLAFVEPKVNRLWKTKGLVHSIFMKRISPTEYTEWQWPLFGMHSIMIEKLARLVRVGGARPSPFTISTMTYKAEVYAPWECRYTPPIPILPLYVLSVSPTTTPGNCNEREWACTPTLTSQGQFYPHDWMYARKQRSLLCVLSDDHYYVYNVCTSAWVHVYCVYIFV